MRRPLVVLTTATGSLTGLADQLRRDGLEVRETPLLAFAPPTDWARVDAAILRLPEFKAVAVTSPRAAKAFAARAAAQRVTAPHGSRRRRTERRRTTMALPTKAETGTRLERRRPFPVGT